MKSIYLCLAIFCAAIALPGCGEAPKTELANEKLTAEDFAEYEAMLGEVQTEEAAYAEEFNDTFGVGQDDKQKISVVDMLGVTIGAVKELSEQVSG